ncbi:MAG: cysteine-rich CWC family protein [Rhizobacter sp.]
MPDAAAAVDDVCPRCGGAFHCGVNDAAPCACTTLKLDAATLTQLNTQYHGCLCLRCLAEIADPMKTAGAIV